MTNTRVTVIVMAIKMETHIIEIMEVVLMTNILISVITS
jgi:hypothetical protein